jgi:hypothetical protein
MERTAKTARVDHSANQTISEVLPRVVGFGVLRCRRYQSRRFRELETHETSCEYIHRMYSQHCSRGSTTDRHSKPQENPVLECSLIPRRIEPQLSVGRLCLHHYSSDGGPDEASGYKPMLLARLAFRVNSSRRVYLEGDLLCPRADQDCPGSGLAGEELDFPTPA